MAGGEGASASLEFTPTWIVAVVCTFIVVISLVVERILHRTGKYLVNKNQASLFEALQKIKEELMFVGFISLLLVIFQGRISKICIPKSYMKHGLPCNREINAAKPDANSAIRHLLAASSDTTGFCDAKGKAPLLSLQALHDLHIFIFVLAVSHVVFSAITILFGGLKIRQWKYWEDAIQKRVHDPEAAYIITVQDHAFVRNRFSGIFRFSIFSWMRSFFKQFYGSVSKSDYSTLRLGFIMTHCKGNPKFNFYKYMNRALENDFKKVVGISWYLWLFVTLFLLVNVYGWHAYFWISFVPLILLLAVGTKLEHIITQLAQEVANKHVAVAGDLVVSPSDDHFWFGKPRLVLLLIHVILFQNAFEISIFLWMLVTYGFTSCIMGEIGYIIPRLVIGVFVQFVCSYSTLPLYAIVAQMGSSFNRAIFEDHIQVGLIGWAHKAQKNKGLKNGGSNQVSHVGSPVVELKGIQVQNSQLEQQKVHDIGYADRVA